MNLDFTNLQEGKTPKRLSPNKVHYATLQSMTLRQVPNGHVLDIVAEGPPLEELEGKGQTAKGAVWFTGDAKEMNKNLTNLAAIATGLGVRDKVNPITKQINERGGSIPELIEAITPIMVGKKGWWITRKVNSAIDGSPIVTSDLVPWAMVHETEEKANKTNEQQIAKGNQKWVVRDEPAYKALSEQPVQNTEPVANW